MLSEAATAASSLYYTTFLWQARQAHARRHSDPGNLNAALCAYFNAAVWCKYGLLAGDRAVFAVNAFGMACSVVLLGVLYAYSVDKGGVERVLWRGLSVFAVFGYVVYCGWLEVGGVGRTAASLSALMFAAPAYNLYKHRHSTRYPNLQPPLDPPNRTNSQWLTAVAGAVSCGLWSGYGVGRGDRWIVMPNVVGFMFSLLQLYIILLGAKAFL